MASVLLIPCIVRRQLSFVSTAFVVVCICFGGLYARLPSRSLSNDRSHDDTRLEPGAPIEQALRSGAQQSFVIVLSAGEFAHLVVDQIGIDVVLTVSAPDGRELATMQSPNNFYGPEEVSLIAETSGDYLITVRSSDKGVADGVFRISLSKRPNASAADTERVNAERNFSSAQKLRTEGTQTALAQAVEKYLLALTSWRQLQDLNAQVNTIVGLEKTYRRLTSPKDQPKLNSEKAKALLDDALEIRRAMRDPYGEGLVLNDLGTYQVERGDHNAAIRAYTEALTVFSAVNDDRDQAATFNYRGLAYLHLGDLEKAKTNFQEALARWEQLKNRAKQAIAVNNLAAVSDQMGDKSGAIERYLQVLPIFKDLNDSGNIANTFNNLGKAYDDLGDWESALTNYREALLLWENPNPDKRIVDLHNNIGMLYVALGEQQQALSHFNQAVSLAPKWNDERSKARTLANLGFALVRFGNYADAKENLERSLEAESTDPRDRAFNLTYRGMAKAGMHDLAGAVADYRSALDIWSNSKDLQGNAFTLQKLGEAQLAAGEIEEAVATLNQALRLNQETHDPVQQAGCLFQISVAQQKALRYEEAEKAIVAALDMIDSIRTRGSSENLRTSFLAARQDYYETAIEVMMNLHHSKPNEGYDLMALQISERKRARSLLDTLNEARADIRQGVAPTLLAEEKIARQKLDEAAARRTSLMSRKHSTEDEQKLESDILNLTGEFQKVEDRIRASSPRYSHLTQPVSLTAQQTRQVLDPDTILLEYSLGDKQSYVWAVTPASVNSFRLPSRAEIETASQRVTKSISERNRSIRDETPEHYRTRIEQADADYAEASAALSKMIIEPVASLLGNKRLAIVADGALQLVSFEALPVPEGDGPPRTVLSQARIARNASAKELTSLIEDHEIVYQPSASVLALQRHELENRMPAPYAVAVLANPVFDKNDPRVIPAITRSGGQRPAAAQTKGTAATSQKSIEVTNTRSSDVTRALDDIGLNRFPALPYSNTEAQAIVRAAGSGRSIAALNFDANRATAMSSELSEYRRIHFATHGVVDFEHPEFSGIILSMVDEKGQPQDGYLRLHDIYNLNLPADLVVLSACQTGIGKQIKGEGLIALTRGFMYAGAQRVVASLWKVDDAATADLMAEFYEQMFTKKLAPAAALRAAQKKMSHQPGRRMPYYWAGFVLQGEWK